MSDLGMDQAWLSLERVVRGHELVSDVAGDSEVRVLPTKGG